MESAVGAHLFNTAETDLRLHYWREGPYEVDFVLHRGPHIVAIEVKSGSKQVNLNGLAEFKIRFQPSKSLIVGKEGVPLSEFLSVSVQEWFEDI